MTSQETIHSIQDAEKNDPLSPQTNDRKKVKKEEIVMKIYKKRDSNLNIIVKNCKESEILSYLQANK
jgi:hypothetical protein